MEDIPIDLIPCRYAGLQGSKPKCRLKPPQVVGYFSLSQEREYRDSLEQLKYIDKKFTERRSEDLNFDLNQGFEIRQPKPAKAETEKLDHILKFIMENASAVSSPDFVGFRGRLRQIMCSPFDQRGDWKILAMKYRGTIYLCGVDTDRQQDSERNKDLQQTRFCAFGYKFEQYLLTDTPKGTTRPEEPVREGEEFCMMFQREVEDMSLLFGAEMDGVESETEIKSLEELRKAKFVELKVKEEESNYRMRINSARFRYLKWWSQSFLTGVEKLVVGSRDRGGKCLYTEPMWVEELPQKAVKILRDPWGPQGCCDFLTSFLRQVKGILKDVDSATDVFVLEYDPYPGHYVHEPAVTCKKLSGPNELSFLPKWYLDFIDQKFRSK